MKSMQNLTLRHVPWSPSLSWEFDSDKPSWEFDSGKPSWAFDSGKPLDDAC